MVTLRHYLICKAMVGGPPYYDVVEYVAASEAQSQGVDFDQRREWNAWEDMLGD